MERRIVSTTILVEWSDNPKPVVLNNDMPNGLANDFDDWLTEVEQAVSYTHLTLPTTPYV